MRALTRLVPVLALVSALGACACDLHDEVMDWAGEGAVSCGLVQLGDPAAEAFACALDHLAAREPFALWVELRGADSHVIEAWAGRDDGSVAHFWYDGDPSGGGGDDDPHIARWSCDDPHAEVVTEDEVAGLHGLALVAGDERLVCGGSTFLEDVCP